jgi:hypothetical protein
MKVARTVLRRGKAERTYLFQLERRPQSRLLHTSPKAKAITLTEKWSYSFIEWFRGFTDGEGSFIISKGSGNKFEFLFEISLHIDDVEVLNYIHNTLGIGKVYIKKDQAKATFLVRTQSEISAIIEIFSKNPLNSSKHLNFLAFERAFSLYINQGRESRQELKPVIESIKDEMNRNRTNFDMSTNHEVRITPYWLLGLIEGDGSFSYNLSKNTFIFIIGQKDNKALMDDIKDYLNNLASSGEFAKDFPSKIEQNTKSEDCLGKFSNAAISYEQIDSQKNIVYNSIVIRQVEYIKTVLIPFLDSISWRTKKEKDYQDWKSILNILDLGLHYKDEGKNLIQRILDQMNNNRLSTSGKPAVDRTLLLSDLAKLLSAGSNYEMKGGRMYIKSLNRYLSTNKTFSVQLIDEANGKVLNSFYSVPEAAKFLGVGVGTVHYRVRHGNRFLFENKSVYFSKEDKQDGDK